MIVRKRKSFVVPCIVGILVSRAQINHSGFGSWLPQSPSNELVKAFILKDDGDRYWKFEFAVPTS